MKKIIIIFNLFVFPSVIVAMFVTFIHLLIHVGDGQIMIPKWYVAEKYELIDTNLIIDYWFSEAIKWGTISGFLTLFIICIVFAIVKKSEKKEFIANERSEGTNI